MSCCDWEEGPRIHQKDCPAYGDEERNYCPCAGSCHHSKHPCSLGCSMAMNRALAAALAEFQESDD